MDPSRKLPKFDPTIPPPGLPLPHPERISVAAPAAPDVSAPPPGLAGVANIGQNGKRTSVWQRLDYPSQSRKSSLPSKKPTPEFAETFEKQEMKNVSRTHFGSDEQSGQHSNENNTGNVEYQSSNSYEEPGSRLHQEQQPVKNDRRDHFQIWNHFCRGRPLTKEGRRGTPLENLSHAEVEQLFKHMVLSGEMALQSISETNEKRQSSQRNQNTTNKWNERDFSSQMFTQEIAQRNVSTTTAVPISRNYIVNNRNK